MEERLFFRVPGAEKRGRLCVDLILQADMIKIKEFAAKSGISFTDPEALLKDKTVVDDVSETSHLFLGCVSNKLANKRPQGNLRTNNTNPFYRFTRVGLKNLVRFRDQFAMV